MPRVDALLTGERLRGVLPRARVPGLPLTVLSPCSLASLALRLGFRILAVLSFPTMSQLSPLLLVRLSLLNKLHFNLGSCKLYQYGTVGDLTPWPTSSKLLPALLARIRRTPSYDHYRKIKLLQ